MPIVDTIYLAYLVLLIYALEFYTIVHEFLNEE
jgi:hypothetical protein